MARLSQLKSVGQAAWICLAVVLLLQQPIGAAVIVVDANCTLADAIESANTDSAVGGCTSGSEQDEIQLTLDVGLSTPLPQLAGGIVLEGNDFEIRRDDGAPDFSVLHLTGTGLIALKNVTVSNGRAPRGGGIYQNGGSLVLDHAVVTGNEATIDGGGIHVESGSLSAYYSTISYNSATFDGGGINAYYYVGPVRLVASTLSGNTAGTEGGGLYHGFQTRAYVTNSTLSGNVAGVDGGGLFISFWDFAVLKNSTIAGNIGGGIGGKYGNCGPYGSCAYMDGTIVADNQGTNCSDVTFAGTMVGNIDDDGSCPADPITPGVDFDVTLADNGGPTLTHALLESSPAVDNAGNCGLATDQRGLLRQGSCDSGSFELGQVPFEISLLGQCPGEMEVVATLAEPNSQVEIFEGPSEGVSQVPSGTCTGTELGVTDPQSVAQFPVDANGEGSVLIDLVAADCGQFLQGVEDLNCNVSDVEPINSCSTLTLGHTGAGQDPVASPASSAGCEDGEYLPGELIQLTAEPDPSWTVGSWSGTDDDASTDEMNILTMPVGEHSVGVNYVEICFDLTLGHIGSGADPAASPGSSPGCAAGEYLPGELIDLTAAPDPGWRVGRWVGTDDPASMDTTNTVTMPPEDHVVEVWYKQACFNLTLGHTGAGTDPVASPGSSAGCEPGTYRVDEQIELSGAVADPGWTIGGWSGTDDDSSTDSTNSLTMPAAKQSVSVNYSQVCFPLTVEHTGLGADPVASPPSSAGCPAATYLPGEIVDLTAAPDPGWEVSGWSGTDDDASTDTSNSVTMPASERTVGVDYVVSCLALTLDHTGMGSDPIAEALGNGGDWAKHLVVGGFTAASAVHAADLDGDGDTDIAGAALTLDEIRWWENVAGDGSSWTERTVAGGFNGVRSLHAADVDGDNDLDLLAAAHFDGLAWWENVSGDGTSWTEHHIALDADFREAWSVDAADLDGDGDLDVLGAAEDDDVAWWENVSGNGSAWVFHPVGPFGWAKSVYAADIDQDGDPDIVAGAAVAGSIGGVYWFENESGDGSTWIQRDVGPGVGSTNSVFAADLDGDTDLDVLGAVGIDNFPALRFVWWRNSLSDGEGWEFNLFADDKENASSVFAADVDGDGDQDALGTSSEDNDIFFWENSEADGVPLVENVIDDDFKGAGSVHAADVDGDGDLDVLSAGIGSSGFIGWWENRYAGCPAGQYEVGDRFYLNATPGPGWEVAGWTGTDNDASTETTNTATMPATDHTISVHYVETPPAGLALAITGTCPGEITVEITNADPNQSVQVFAGSGPGTSQIQSGPCAGTELDLANARRWRTIATDASGEGSLTTTVNANWCSRQMQALDRSCSTSNTAQLP